MYPPESENDDSQVWEDHLLERKVESDLKDLKKTLVGFANSVRPGHTAVLLIGEKDGGEVVGVQNPDGIQKTVRKEADEIYPPIVWRSAVYGDAKKCVRVEVEYSSETPHFAGAAWVRRGSETIKATPAMLDKLIALRSSKMREIEQYLGREVSVRPRTSNSLTSSFWMSAVRAIVVQVTQFYVLLDVTVQATTAPIYRRALPASAIELNWDTQHDRLQIIAEE
jgi:hypothetical protein